MTWVTWRQHRTEAAVAGLILALFAIDLLVTGRQMYAAASLLSDHGGRSQAAGFTEFMQRFLNIGTLTKQALVVLPAILGVFVGAPLLAREIDHGTHQFAWTQSVTRVRWFMVKAGLLSGATLVGAALLAGLASWWHHPLDVLFGNGSWFFFTVIGVAPVAYALFALALGVAAGTFIQRTVPAMGATLLLFTVARVVINFLRPRYMAPVVSEINFNQSFPRDALPTAQYWVDGNSNRVPIERVNQLIQQTLSPNAAGPAPTVSGGPGLFGRAIPSGPMSPVDLSAVSQSLHDHGLHYLAVYQPGDRFWIFQAIEAGIFLLLALALIGLSAWWLRHRVR